MKSCAEYKGLIDSQADLDEVQATGLALHLEDCADCSEYKTEADKTQALFRDLHRSFEVDGRPDRAYQAVSRRLKESRRQMFLALAGTAACAVAPAVIWLRGDLTTFGGFVFLLIGSLCGFFAWWLSRGPLTFLPRSQREDSFYEDWRRTLERQIRITTIVAGFVSAELVVGVLLIALQDRPFLHEGATILFGLAFLMCVGVLYTFFMELPQLRRELALARDCAGA